jgi:hypothetical protein
VGRYDIIQRAQKIIAEVERRRRQLAEEAAVESFYSTEGEHISDWISRNLMIVDPAGELGPFRLNATNRKFFDAFEKQRKEGRPVRIILMAPRRSFKSSGPAALAFWWASSKPNQHVRIVAHRESAADAIFRYVMRFWEELPSRVRRRLKFRHTGYLEFDNHSIITINTAENTKVGRGEHTHFLHVAEVAYIRDPENALRSLLRSVPTTVSDTVVVFESTPNAYGDYFHRMWQQAVEGMSEYEPIFTSWLEIEDWRAPVPRHVAEAFELYKKLGQEVGHDPWDQLSAEIADVLRFTQRERELVWKYGADIEQISWRRRVMSDPDIGGDDWVFEREYPTHPDDCFVSTSSSVFPVDVLTRVERLTRPGQRGQLVYNPSYRNEVAFQLNAMGGDLMVWEHPQDGVEYVIGVDPALGRNADWNAAVVIRRDNENVVAHLRNRDAPGEFALQVDLLRRYYACSDGRLGYTICESQTGLAVLITLEEIDPDGLFYQVNRRARRVPGIWMTEPLKRYIISLGIESAREADIPSEELVREMKTFLRNERGTAAAQPPHHDDLVMAWLLAVYYNRSLPSVEARVVEESEDKIDLTCSETSALFWRRKWEKERAPARGPFVSIQERVGGFAELLRRGRYGS